MAKPVGVTKCVGETKPVGVTKRVGETKPVATHPLFTEVYDLNKKIELLSVDSCSYYFLLLLFSSFFFLSFFLFLFLSNLNFFFIISLTYVLVTYVFISHGFSPPPIPPDISQPAKTSAAKPT